MEVGVGSDFEQVVLPCLLLVQVQRARSVAQSALGALVSGREAELSKQ